MMTHFVRVVLKVASIVVFSISRSLNADVSLSTEKQDGHPEKRWMNVWSLFCSMEEEIVIYIHLQQIPICCCLPACLPAYLSLCLAGGRCELNITPDELMNIRFHESRRSLDVSAVVERRWRRRPRSGGVTRKTSVAQPWSNQMRKWYCRWQLL